MRVAAQNSFERGHNLIGAFGRRAVSIPQLPGPQIHHAVGKQRRGIQIVRILAREFAHGKRVVDIELVIIRICTAGEALRQRIDVVFLDLWSIRIERLRFFDCGFSDFLVLGIDRKVVVWPGRKRHAPPGHRQLRIKLGRALKRARRLFVIEGVHEPNSLVEELLSFSVCGGYGVMQVAKPRHQSCGL